MSQSIQTGQTTVSGSVTTTVSTLGGSALTPLCGKNNHASTPTTIGTVGAGKQWKIYGVYMEKTNTYNTGATDSYLKVNGVTVIEINDAGNPVVSSVALNLGTNYLLATAGQTVTMLSGNGAAYCSGGILYVEETV